MNDTLNIMSLFGIIALALFATTLIYALISAHLEYQDAKMNADSACKQMGYDIGKLSSSDAPYNKVYCFYSNETEGKEIIINMGDLK